MERPRFSPTIDLGHIMQAAVVVLGMVGAYVTISRNQATEDAKIEALYLTIAAEHEAVNTRFAYDETRMDRSDTEKAAFEAEQRQAMVRIADALDKILPLLPDNKGRHGAP